jgi:CubicO group peptidase (beta-lactamase class C family)
MSQSYVPPAHGTAEWASIAPVEAGFDAAGLAAAVTFAAAHETPWRRDIQAQLEAGNFEPPPDNDVIGRTAPRGAPNGLILRHGRIVASWGDTRRVDMTFSVAKSYLSILAGIAVADGLIADIDAPVGETVRDGGFDGLHNGAITWRHLLTLTSEWEGTLFGKPDSIDRNRSLSGGDSGGAKGSRVLQAPGTFWEYNDVRVNRLSLALLRRFDRALPEIFAARVMRPIGASEDWRWEGYRTSFVEAGGRQVQSVSGGGHWGGGVFIHAEDQARIGLLMLRRGDWAGTRLLDPAWIAQATNPCALNHEYGFLWWLNTRRTRWPSAPESSFCAVGAGGNLTWIDPEHELVAVLRWTDPAAMDGFMARVMAAIRVPVELGA